MAARIIGIQNGGRHPPDATVRHNTRDSENFSLQAVDLFHYAVHWLALLAISLGLLPRPFGSQDPIRTTPHAMRC